MALPPLATVEDLQTWLGSEITDAARADAILTAASTLVRTHTGRAWVDADGEPEEGPTDTQQEAARTVVLMVSARVWNNPNGYTQQATGPFSHSVAAWAALGLELTDTEKAMIGGVPAGIPGLTSIRVIAPAAAAGSRYYTTDWWEADEDDE